MPPSVKIKVILSRTVDLLLMFILYTEEMQGTTRITWQGNVLAVYERRSHHSGIDNYTPERYYDYVV